MNTLTRTKSVIVGLSALTLLGMTACSGEVEAADDPETDNSTDDAPATEEQSEGTSSEAVFTFHAQSDLVAQELRIQLPEQLMEVAGDYGENRLMDHFIVRAAEHAESQCAIEVEYGYAEGGKDRIENSYWGQHGRVNDGVEIDWDDFQEAWYEELEEFEDAQLNLEPEDFYERYPDGWPEEDDFLDEYADEGWFDTGIEDRYARVLGLDFEEVEVSDNYSSMISTQSCAESPHDDSSTTTLSFRPMVETSVADHIDQVPPETPYDTGDNIASVTLNIMASGYVNVVDSKVNGYHFSGDEHGWLSDDQTVDSQGNVIDG